MIDRKTIVRAWRDPLFRLGLPGATLMELPRHPAGESAEDDGISCTVPGITFGSGCLSLGCTKVVCTDPCTRTNKIQCATTSDQSGCTKKDPCFRISRTGSSAQIREY